MGFGNKTNGQKQVQYLHLDQMGLNIRDNLKIIKPDATSSNGFSLCCCFLVHLCGELVWQVAFAKFWWQNLMLSLSGRCSGGWDQNAEAAQADSCQPAPNYSHIGVSVWGGGRVSIHHNSRPDFSATLILSGATQFSATHWNTIRTSIPHKTIKEMCSKTTSSQFLPEPFQKHWDAFGEEFFVVVVCHSF